MELGKQFLRQRSALSVTFEIVVRHAVIQRVAVIQPRSNDGTSEATLCATSRGKELAEAVARTVDENYKPGLSLSLECRTSSTSRV